MTCVFLSGLICFSQCSINQDFFLAIIILILSMLFINLYGLITQSLYKKSFIYLFSATLFFIAISVFGNYGIEQKPIGYETFYSFHLEGVAASLFLFLISSSILFVGTNQNNEIKNTINPIKTLPTSLPKIKKSKNIIKSNDWEEASAEDVHSGQYQVYKS